MATEPLDVANLVAAAGGERWTGMPAGTVIGHVHLHVGDIEAATEFYHRGIGFDRTVWSYPGALFMSAGGYHHHLGTNTWARGAAPAGENDARLLEWTIAVPAASAVDEVAASMTGAGYEIENEGGALLLTDPWGTRVRVKPQGAPGT
jgi:catechol 2,3-dioxygenase